jgi:glycosyltransferase involved in cell wall biosynthesis
MPVSLAVVVPFYRGMPFLERLMTSLTREPIEEIIFAVDDAESGPALRRAVAAYANVTVVETPGTIGTAGARNLGLQAATAEWVTFVDQDDWWPSNFVERLAVQDTDEIVAYDNNIWSERDGSLERHATTVLENAKFTTTTFDRTSPVVYDWLPMFKIVLRRSDALRAGGYSTWAYAIEDLVFLMRLLSLGLRVDVRAEPRGDYLWHPDSISQKIAAGSSKLGRRAFRTWMRLYLELALNGNFPLRARRAFVWCFGVATKEWLLRCVRLR